MGRPMARNLLKRGFTLVVHSRSRGRSTRSWRPARTAAASPAEVARQATRIITMLPDGPDVERGARAARTACCRAIQRGTILIDMSTIAPATARRLAADAECDRRVDARCAGERRRDRRHRRHAVHHGRRRRGGARRPCGRSSRRWATPSAIIHIGESGAGQICKACNQLVIGGTLAAVGEAFALARKSGVDPAKVRAALLGGFAASRVLEVHGDSAAAEEFQARISRAPLPQGSANRPRCVERRARARAGHGRRATAAHGAAGAGQGRP